MLPYINRVYSSPHPPTTHVPSTSTNCLHGCVQQPPTPLNNVLGHEACVPSSSLPAPFCGRLDGAHCDGDLVSDWWLERRIWLYEGWQYHRSSVTL